MKSLDTFSRNKPINDGINAIGAGFVNFGKTFANAPSTRSSKKFMVTSANRVGKFFKSWSDIRLKKNIRYFATLNNGIKYYTYDWNETAQKLYGLYGTECGPIAQELNQNWVEKDEYGYLFIKKKYAKNII